MVTAGTPNLAATAGPGGETEEGCVARAHDDRRHHDGPTITRVIRPLPMPALLAECSRVSMAPMALRDSAKSSAQTMSATTGPNTLPMPSRKLDSPAKAVRTERVRSSSHSMPIKTDSSMATSTLTLMLVTRAWEGHHQYEGDDGQQAVPGWRGHLVRPFFVKLRVFAAMQGRIPALLTVTVPLPEEVQHHGHQQHGATSQIW